MGEVRGFFVVLAAGALVLWSVGGCASEDESGDATEAPAVGTQPVVPDTPHTVPAQPLTPTSQIDATPVESSAPFADVAVGATVTLENLLPWDGGFLAIGTIANATALNRPLPDDVVALFPPEVVALFPDGLPPTIDEATRILQEAGLYDTVAEIVADNRLARDAIFAESQGPVRLVEWSEDGDAWARVEASLPETLDATSLVAAGDHLVGFGTPLPGFMNVPTETIVASTTDLVAWHLEEIAPDPPVDLPAGVAMTTTPEVIVANHSGWTLERTGRLEVFAEAMVADTFDVDITDVTVFYTVEEGLVVRVPASDGAGTVDLVVSWEDLGFDELLMPYLYNSGERYPSVPEIWAASWDAEPARTDPRLVDAMSAHLIPMRLGPIAATSSGFLQLSGPVWFSADGVEWSEAVTPADLGGWGGEVAQVLPIGDRLAVILAFSEPSAYLVDAGGQVWEPIDLGGLPDVNPWIDDQPLSRMNTLPSPWIVYAWEPTEDPPGAWVVATLNGTSWLIEEVVDDADAARTAPRAALTGSTLMLVDRSGTWLRYALTS